MIQKSISVEQFIQCKVYRFAGLLQMPFRENGFAPLYPLLKSKKLMGFLITYSTMCKTFAASTGVDASSGLGYVQWVHGNRFDFYTHYGNLHWIRLQT